MKKVNLPHASGDVWSVDLWRRSDMMEWKRAVFTFLCIWMNKASVQTAFQTERVLPTSKRSRKSKHGQ